MQEVFETKAADRLLDLSRVWKGWKNLIKRKVR